MQTYIKAGGKLLIFVISDLRSKESMNSNNIKCLASILNLAARKLIYA